MSNKRACPYKTLDGQSEGDGDFSSITIENITIQSPNTLPTYTLTLPQNDGNAGQILSTNGSGVLAWVNDSVGTGTVTSVSVTVPSYQTVTVLNSTTTPAIQISGSATGTGIVALQTQPFFTDFIGISADYFTNPGLAEVLKLRSDENIAQEIKISFAKNAVKNEFGFYFDPANSANNYYYVTVGTKSLLFMGLASFTFPTTTGSAGQVLSTDGFGNTSWVTRGTVTSVSVTVPSYQTVTVLNSTTTPTIQISGSATGTGIVALQTQPFFTDFIGISSDYITNPGLAEVLKLRNDENIAQEIKVTFAKNLVKNEFGFYFDPANAANNYYYVTVGSKSLLFMGLASFTFPTTTGSAGQVLSTDGFGNTSWVTRGTVTSVSVTVPSYQTVTVLNSTTTPTIQISGSATGTGIVALQTQPFFTDFIGISSDFITNPGLAEVLKLRNDENIAQEIKVTFAKNAVKNEFGFYFDPANSTNNYYYVTVGSKSLLFTGYASFTFPTTTGSAGQVLSTDGFGNTSWVSNGGTVTSVSASVPSWLSVTVTNPTTTPAIAITGSSTGTGTVSVLQNSPTINNTLTVSDKIEIPRNSGNGEAIRIHNANTSFPSTNYIVVGHNSSARNHAHFGHNIVSSGNTANYAYIETNGNRFVFNGAANFALPLTTGTAGQALITDGAGNTSWTTLPTGTVTSVSGTTPINSSGGTTPTISLSTVPTTLGGTGLTTVGTNGQVLTSNGSSLLWTTPTTGTVTSVAATSPLASSGGSTPTISIASSTGTGAVVLAQGPQFVTGMSLVDTGNDTNAPITTGNGQFLSIEAHNLANSLKRPIILNGYGGNVGIGTTTPATRFHVDGGQTYLNSDGETLILGGSTHTYLRWRIGATNYGFFGFTAGGAQDLALYNERATGNIDFDMANASGSIRFFKKIQLQSLVTIQTTGATAYTLTLPANAGSANQVLTTNGAGVLSWTTPGGGGGGVTSVSATSPLASSGGATPTISIASSTGTGGVVLDTTPTINTRVTVTETGTGSVTNTAYDLVRASVPNLVSNGSVESFGAIKIGRSFTTSNQSFGIAYGNIGGSTTGAFLGYFTANGTIDGPNYIGLRFQTSRIATNLTFDFNNAVNITGQIFTFQNSNITFGQSSTYSSDITFLTPSFNAGFSDNVYSLYAIGRRDLQNEMGYLGFNHNATAASRFVTLGMRGATTRINDPQIRIFNSGFTGFSNNNTYNLVITSAGNVGIGGVVNPDGRLHVEGNSIFNAPGSSVRMRLTHDIAGPTNYIQSGLTTPGSSVDLSFGPIVSTTSYMMIKASGDVGINQTAPTQKLHVTGNVRADLFTTNNTTFFGYNEGSWTPRLGAFHRSNGLLYEIGAILPGDLISINYVTQSGYYVKLGKHITINVELRWQMLAGNGGAANYDIVIILPAGFSSPNSMVVPGACLNWPNIISGVPNPMGTLLQFPIQATGGNISAIFITSATSTIAYPTSSLPGTQGLNFAFTWCVTA